ncbi:MAG TPA: hypothetical protein VGJ70_09565, partial [Solirubrobacteraceae bacterium]
MRKLVVIAAEQYVRNLVAAGAFDEIDDDTFYVSGGLRDLGPLEDHPRYLGAIEGAADRRATYLKLRRLLLASYRFRSRTQRIKLRFVPPVQRLILRLQSLPGPRQVLSRRYLRQTGLNPQLHALMEEVRPDLVIAPSGGTDNLVIDALRSAQALGIRSLLLVYNWDNLSSKGTFPVKPDHLGVVGPQSVEHAWRIHRIPGERVTVLGAPYIDSYFFHEPGSTASPFPFRYALFAGCYMPFDELTPLRALEAAIEERGLDLKVVYRPHPQRRRRKVADFFDEREFRHVVLDPQVRDGYRQAAREQTEGEDAPAPLPALDYYPALLEHAQFVICPLSTMVLESAIFERRVIAVAYHDGVHKDSPGVVIGYDHFQGMDAIDGLEMCRRAEDLVPLFLRLVGDPAPRRSLRDQVHPWIYHDERPYRRRLAEL